MKIYIYLHICTINVWEIVVEDLFSKLQKSGLLDKCDELRVSVLGEHVDRVKEILATDKLQLIFQSTDMSLFERPCLEHIRKSAEIENFNVLYLHSKGIQEKNDPYRENINDWINLMCHYLIDKHVDCLSFLNIADAVGTNFVKVNPELLGVDGNGWHFSGNFWWSKSQYIKQLPEKIGPNYLDPEMWIGFGTGMIYSLHRSHCSHYHKPYPRNRYIGSISLTRTKINKI